MQEVDAAAKPLMTPPRSTATRWTSSTIEEGDSSGDESSYTPLSTPASSSAAPRARSAAVSPAHASLEGYTPLVEMVSSVRVISFEERADASTVFVLLVVLAGHEPYELRRRYSHFEALRALLVARAHQAVPALPGKSLRPLSFPADLRARALALDEWLSALLARGTARASADFLLFLIPGSDLEEEAGLSAAVSETGEARARLTWLRDAFEERFDVRSRAVFAKVECLEESLRQAEARADAADARAASARGEARLARQAARAIAGAAACAAVAARTFALELEAEDAARELADASAARPDASAAHADAAVVLADAAAHADVRTCAASAGADAAASVEANNETQALSRLAISPSALPIAQAASPLDPSAAVLHPAHSSWLEAPVRAALALSSPSPDRSCADAAVSFSMDVRSLSVGADVPTAASAAAPGAADAYGSAALPLTAVEDTIVGPRRAALLGRLLRPTDSPAPAPRGDADADADDAARLGSNIAADAAPAHAPVDPGAERAFRRWRLASALGSIDILRLELERAKDELESAAASLRARERAVETDAAAARAATQAAVKAPSAAAAPSRVRASAAGNKQLSAAVTRLMLGFDQQAGRPF